MQGKQEQFGEKQIFYHTYSKGSKESKSGFMKKVHICLYLMNYSLWPRDFYCYVNRMEGRKEICFKQSNRSPIFVHDCMLEIAIYLCIRIIYNNFPDVFP